MIISFYKSLILLCWLPYLDDFPQKSVEKKEIMFMTVTFLFVNHFGSDFAGIPIRSFFFDLAVGIHHVKANIPFVTRGATRKTLFRTDPKHFDRNLKLIRSTSSTQGLRCHKPAKSNERCCQIHCWFQQGPSSWSGETRCEI